MRGHVKNHTPAKYSRSPVPKGFVYLLGSREQGWYKIGWSYNIDERLGKFHGTPFLLEVLGIWETTSPLELEKFLHEQHASQRIGRTEWFRLTPAETAKFSGWVELYEILAEEAREERELEARRLSGFHTRLRRASAKERKQLWNEWHED